ncbi:MAG: metallophosphoesterase [Candidatus Zixiibacteriota bacterium]|nr:MAG: metallophosphoesterase [candidate division Zixibacteria bacterium]
MSAPGNKIGKILIIIVVFALGGISGFLIGNHYTRSQHEIGYADAESDSVELASITDGPYVYWEDSGKAIAFYICGGELIRREFQSSDTIKFNGLCHDSTATYKIPVREHSIDNYIFEDVRRIFAVSDVHGEYDYMLDILRGGGVIDESGNWAFGEGHLVINGDIVDRGDKVTECLWFVYALEQEAIEAGGRVHFLLGNHELMVMQGDLRYINRKYSYGITKKSRISYDRLFSTRTEFGRWFRKKNTMLMINGILFVHGGVSHKLIEGYENIGEINEALRNNIALSPFYKVLGEEEAFLYGGMGPLWYRGLISANGYPRVNSEQLHELLDFFGASSFVVGHTLGDSVQSHFGGGVFSIGVYAEDLLSLEALLWEDGVFYRVRGNGERKVIN